ncbi:MAG: flagellin [Alphaproteobacteria bacterium]|nr:flagellin [Alphaproteobacteria bacterium]
MTSDVVLTAALRNNLLSLQNTQRLIDSTQLRLATGLKVNSALDNAQNYFSSQSLNNRATDLGRLLDGLSQSIRTIEEASIGITALNKLVDQAEAIAVQAQDALTDGSSVAKITGNVDLSGITDLTDLTGIADNDQITFTIDAADGTAITLDDAQGSGAGVVQIDTGDSIDQLIATINDFTDAATGEQALKASLDSDGQLQIESLQGGKLRVNFSTGGINLAGALGLDSITLGEYTDSAAVDQYAVTVGGGAVLKSNVFYKATGSAAGLADASTLLSVADNSGGTNQFTGAATDVVVIGVDGGSLVTIGDVTTASFQSVVDTINSNTTLNTKIQASFDDTTGQLYIQSLDSSVKTIQIGIRDVATNGASANFGFGLAGAATTTTATPLLSTESIAFGAAASTLASLESDFNEIRTQIDSLVNDANYKGVNLLNGDDLTTYFDENRNNSLVTTGGTFTSAGLGIDEATFRDIDTVTASLNQVRDAVTDVRNFGSSISNDLAVIQTRQDFTKATINTLTSGADDLIVADQNEEGANLLALQTRQALGTTSLSLASQSQQSVLRLF